MSNEERNVNKMIQQTKQKYYEILQHEYKCAEYLKKDNILKKCTNKTQIFFLKSTYTNVMLFINKS